MCLTVYPYSTSRSDTVFTPGSGCGWLHHISHFVVLSQAKIQQLLKKDKDAKPLRHLHSFPMRTQICRIVKWTPYNYVSSRMHLCTFFYRQQSPPAITKLHEPWDMLNPLRVSADLHGENQFEHLSLVGGKMCKDHRKICSDTGRSWLLNIKKALTELCPGGLLCVSH